MNPTQKQFSLKRAASRKQFPISLKNAVDSGRLPADAAKRATELLDERARHYLKTREAKWEPVTGPWAAFENSGWKDRDDRLLALCAEAAKVVGGK